MARLTNPTATNSPGVCFVITAYLQHGITLSRSLTLDGLLAAVLRQTIGQGEPGSLVDGGLDQPNPVDWSLPLTVCEPEPGSQLWHWAASNVQLHDHDGPLTDRVLTDWTDGIPDVHRLSTRLDETRAVHTAVRIPVDAGGNRGRFRKRITPVLTIPAVRAVWTGIAPDPSVVFDLLVSVPAIGARRSRGEGTVTGWVLTTFPDVTDPVDQHVWAHTDPVHHALTRPVPMSCVETLPVGVGGPWTPGSAGVRPPLFHPARQTLLAIPTTPDTDVDTDMDPGAGFGVEDEPVTNR